MSTRVTGVTPSTKDGKTTLKKVHKMDASKKRRIWPQAKNQEAAWLKKAASTKG